MEKLWKMIETERNINIEVENIGKEENIGKDVEKLLRVVLVHENIGNAHNC